jgi:hypothetical protein
MRPLGVLSRAIVGGAVACVALLALALIASAFQQWQIERALSNPGLTYGDLMLRFDGGGPTAIVTEASLLLSGLTALVTVGCFLAWLYRARRNVDGFEGACTLWGWGWSVVAWLVPVANLVLPAVIVAETARESLPAEKRPFRKKVTWLARGWWVAANACLGLYGYGFINSTSRGVAFVMLYGSPSDPVPADTRARYLEIFGNSPSVVETVAVLLPPIVVAVLTVMLVTMVTAVQHRRAEI